MNSTKLFDLSGRVALVTGGSSGIGRGLCYALAEAGSKVVVADTQEEAGNETAASIRATGRDSFFVNCDVSQEAEVKAMMGRLVAEYGRLDIAVNNAGIFCPGRDEEHSQNDWDRVIGVNLTGAWLCCREEMRQMAAQQPCGGKIINVASIGGVTVCSNGSYDASKAGLIHLSRTLAANWGAYNINVNCISPGRVISALGTIRSAEERGHLRDYTPLGYVQRIDDLAGPVVFLASEAANYVTGQNLIVDGGHTLATWLAPLERHAAPRVSPAEEALSTEPRLG